MTYSIRHIVGVITRETREGFLGTKLPLFGKTWGEKKLVGSWTLNDFYVYAVGCHVGHSTEALVALFAYWLFFSDGTWATECATFRAPWVLEVLAFHLGCEATFVGGWHYSTYVSSAAKGLQPFKFNARHQYEPDAYEEDGARVGVLSSSTGHLQREIFYNTLGWLQSGCWQCLMTWAWASGALAVAPDFASRLWPNLLGLHLITYWREIHFYWCHRGIHPWWDMRNGLRQGDVGAFLYRWAHSLHHKSHNPGPWSGLSMHPVEHFLYYSCAWLLPLFFTVHPLHFLYAKYTTRTSRPSAATTASTSRAATATSTTCTTPSSSATTACRSPWTSTRCSGPGSTTRNSRPTAGRCPRPSRTRSRGAAARRRPSRARTAPPPRWTSQC